MLDNYIHRINIVSNFRNTLPIKYICLFVGWGSIASAWKEETGRMVGFFFPADVIYLLQKYFAKE